VATKRGGESLPVFVSASRAALCSAGALCKTGGAMPGPDPKLVELLARRALDWRGPITGLQVLGLSGAQGSGKSTLVRALASRLEAEGLRVAALSLDDLYLTRAQRLRLAREVHPLFATRGVPGTHDPALGLATIAALAQGEAAPLPRFDKGRDDRLPEAQWPRAPADTQVLLLEGWCLGAAPQPQADLARPVNALEAAEDAGGIWRAHANAALNGPYRQLFAAIDRLILLAAPDWQVVAKWREQQEAELRVHAPGAMTPAEVTRFIQHYERLTRWILEEMPLRADLSIRLGDAREVLAPQLKR
jgi:D-glycerate 3-kinase